MSHQSSTQPPVEGVAPPDEEQLAMHQAIGESLAAGDRTGPSIEEWWARRRKPWVPPLASGRADLAGCSALYFAGDSTVVVHGPSGFMTMTPDNQRADLPSRLLCELALAVLANRPDFEAIKDKRMGELTPAQQDDAREQWLRKQISDAGRSPHDLESHIVFLLRRLDAARGVVA